jgi:hypothetical protein
LTYVLYRFDRDSVKCSLRGSNTPQANYEFAAFTRLLKEQVGIVGLHPIWAKSSDPA